MLTYLANSDVDVELKFWLLMDQWTLNIPAPMVCPLERTHEPLRFTDRWRKIEERRCTHGGIRGEYDAEMQRVAQLVLLLLARGGARVMMEIKVPARIYQ